MIKFINKLTGSDMYVDESREKEYIEAGHKLASDVSKPKTTRKRTTKKKVEN